METKGFLLHLNTYVRPHQINFMDDRFSAEKNEKSELIFFFKKILISPENRASKEATIFFFFKLIFAKMGRAEMFFVFFFKERNVTLT